MRDTPVEMVKAVVVAGSLEGCWLSCLDWVAKRNGKVSTAWVAAAEAYPPVEWVVVEEKTPVSMVTVVAGASLDHWCCGYQA